MSYVEPGVCSDSAGIRREGNALDADPATEDPPQVRHDPTLWDHSAAVWRVLDGSGSTRPDR